MLLLLLELLLGRIACGTRSFPFQFVLALGMMIHIRLGAKFSGAEGAGVQLDAGVCGKVFLVAGGGSIKLTYLYIKDHTGYSPPGNASS